MRGLIIAAVILTAPRGANACLIERPFSPTDVNKADVVVIGRISQYSAFPNSASFVIAVDEVLKGRESEREASHSLHVTMSRWIAGPPWTQPPLGPVLIALNPPAVLVEVCGGPFILPVGSDEAQQVRRVLKGLPPVAPELPERAGVPVQPSVPVAAPVFAIRPTWANMRDYYPARAWEDKVEGKATIQCAVRDESGRLTCVSVSDTPRGYGFGTAAVRLFQDKARVKSDVQGVGSMVKMSWKWLLR